MYTLTCSWYHSDRAASLQDMNTHNFLEVGAAALLVGDMEAKMKGQPWKYFGTADMPYLDQLLQPSSVATITNSASARPHLRAITSSKRTKLGSHQIWHVFQTQTICLILFHLCVLYSNYVFFSLISFTAITSTGTMNATHKHGL